MEKIKVNNVPKYAYNYKYMAIVRVGEEYWFFASYNDNSNLPKEFYDRDMDLVELDKVEAI